MPTYNHGTKLTGTIIRHVVLYAHSTSELVLLAIKHQHQLNDWAEYT